MQTNAVGSFSLIAFKSGWNALCCVTREHNADKDPQLLPVFLLLDYQQSCVEPDVSPKEQQL